MREMIVQGKFLEATKHLYNEKCVAGFGGHDLIDSHEGIFPSV